MIAPMSRAAVFAGADCLIIEVHPDPEHALCDGPQSLYIPSFEKLSASLTPLVEFEWKLR